MLDYNQINTLFGAPLNAVGRPNIPFKLKTWHVIGGLVLSYFAYQGIKKMLEEKMPKVIFIKQDLE
jgi:hypothetical protein